MLSVYFTTEVKRPVKVGDQVPVHLGSNKFVRSLKKRWLVVVLCLALVFPAAGVSATGTARADDGYLLDRVIAWPDGSTEHVQIGDDGFFILDGAKDNENKSLALFPETLKSEVHGIRATIEAFSRRGKLDGQEDASACGIGMSKGSTWNHAFRVTVQGAQLDYKIDRWD